MLHAVRILGVSALVIATLGSVHAALKDSRIEKNHVDKIRLTDSGPFQVWNGFDADSQNPGARVLAVIGAKKSLRVNYTGSMQPPQVTMGPGWVDVVAGQGTALTFSGPKSDCHYGRKDNARHFTMKGRASGKNRKPVGGGRPPVLCGKCQNGVASSPMLTLITLLTLPANATPTVAV